MTKSPGRKALAKATRGSFTPSLPPVVGALPDDVETLFRSINRKERRKFAAKARAHARAKAKAEKPKRHKTAGDGAYIPELRLTVVADDGTPTVPLVEGLKDIYSPREMAKLAPKPFPKTF